MKMTFGPDAEYYKHCNSLTCHRGQHEGLCMLLIPDMHPLPEPTGWPYGGIVEAVQRATMDAAEPAIHWEMPV